MTGYLDQLSQIQNQIFTLARKATFSSPDPSFDSEFSIVTNDLNTVINAMRTSNQALPANTPQKRDLLILFNATSLMQSALFQFKQLNTSTSEAEKMILLEDYFRFRIEAKDTISLVRSLINESL